MKKLQAKIHEIIFEADTLAGKFFDVALLIAIVASVAAVMLESVVSINQKYGYILRIIEWVFTILFTIEYLARIISSKNTLSYIFSFYGLIDLMSIVPTYLSLYISGTHSLLVIRTIRLLRVFRIFKLARFTGQGRYLMDALKSSREKITIFLTAVLSLVIIMGTLMYLIEGSASGFTSIPRSIYWAIVTLTTVGYGDIAPQTPIGQFLAAIVMITGYAVIAVPTGIVTAELTKGIITNKDVLICPGCSLDRHDYDAIYCKKCGSRLIRQPMSKK